MGSTGFFGKLPAAGDFVARSLPQGLRPVLDRWLTRNLAELARTPQLWPENGLRGIWSAPGFDAIPLLILPSQDASGRCFPLAFCVDGQDADQPGVDRWADTVLDCVDLSMTPSEMAQALSALTAPAAVSEPTEPPIFWAGALTGPIEALIKP